MPSGLTETAYVFQFTTDAVNRIYDYVILTRIDSGEQWLGKVSDANLSTRTLSWVKFPSRAEMDALSSRIAQQYKGTGTYASLDPIKPNDERYLGGIIDYVVDTYLQSQDINSTNTYTIANGGPTFSITLMKLNNDYFCGTAMSYHAATQSTVWYFKNYDGQKCLIPLTPITI